MIYHSRGLTTQMSWFEIDANDAFFPIFDETTFRPSFEELSASVEQPDDQTDLVGLSPSPTSSPLAGSDSSSLGSDGQSLMNQNAELRQTALSLRERFE
jgi:hypothetical protein